MQMVADKDGGGEGGEGGKKLSFSQSQSLNQQSPPPCRPTDALEGDGLLPPESTTPDDQRLPFTTIVTGQKQTLATYTIVCRRQTRPLADRHSVPRMGLDMETSVRSDILGPHSDAQTDSIASASGSAIKSSGRVARRPSMTEDREGAVQNKRSKMAEHSPTKADTIAVMPEQSRSNREPLATNDEQIMGAVSRSAAEPDLIGDLTGPHILPLGAVGRHEDLKYISRHTLARLLLSEFREQVASYEIIDCRYPYEFDAGNIRGAKNYYTREQIIQELLVQREPEQRPTQGQGSGRHILVFHCEFSAQRGPTLLRFLRNYDRNLNVDRYPALHHPEVYLLRGGYFKFFKSYPLLCDPVAYRTMTTLEYADERRHYQALLYRDAWTTRSRYPCAK